MPVPRYRPLLICLAILAAAFFVPMDFRTNTTFFERLMDVAHLPAFGLLVWLLFRTNPCGFVSRSPALAFAAVTAIALAGAVELLQTRAGREASWIDFTNGMVGALFAAGFLATRSDLTRVLFAFGALAALAVVAQPAAREARSIVWRTAHFPLLGDFESDDELPLWLSLDRDRMVNRIDLNRIASRSNRHATSGRSSLRVPIYPTGWPGVRLLCADQNWAPYRALVFDLYNEGTPFELSLRIDDAHSLTHSDRYNGAFKIAAGANTIRLPLEQVIRHPLARPLDLSAIRRVVFFVNQPVGDFSVYLDHVHLE